MPAEDKALDQMKKRNTTEEIRELESKRNEDVIDLERETDPQRSDVSWMLSPAAREVQISPPQWFQDRLNIFTNLRANETNEGKNIPISWFQAVGINPFQFINPSDITAWNTWMANKAAFWGNPGNHFTDYPSAYKK